MSLIFANDASSTINMLVHIWIFKTTVKIFLNIII